MNKLTSTFVLLLVFLSGCATTEKTPEQREWDKAAMKLNWENCVALYQESPRALFLHYQHEPGEERAIDYRSDLAYNECKKYLGSEWVQ